MDIRTENAEGVLVVAPEGRIDGINALEFQEAVNSEIDSSVTRVVIDMAGLNYISSAGLRAVLLISKALQQRNSRLVLCTLQVPIKEVFQISGFDQIISIRDTREEALVAVNQ